MPPSPIPRERLYFKCPSCQMTLSLEKHLAGVTGPCPACGLSVTAPSLPPAAPAPSASRSEGFRKSSSKRSRGRIPADSAIDHGHMEQRETLKALRIFLWFVLTFCACLLVTWFMKDWIRR